MPLYFYERVPSSQKVGKLMSYPLSNVVMNSIA